MTDHTDLCASPAEESDPLMPIGMFSRASLVSVKALRSYHEQGLLVPDSVDPTTGYRSYRVSQLTDAAVIKRLRDLDLPLRDIAKIVAGRDPHITRGVIAQHEVEMRQRLSDLRRIVAELQEAVHRPEMHTPVHVRDEPPAHALSYAGQVTDGEYAPFLDHAYSVLLAALEATGAMAVGCGSATYSSTVDGDDEPVQAHVRIDRPVMVPEQVQAWGVTLTLLPAERCAIATHVGGYDTIGDTYRHLGAWVARHAVSADRPIREYYVVSVDPETGALLPDDLLRTEICWPITFGGPPHEQET